MTLYGIQDAPPAVLLSYALRLELGLEQMPELARSEGGKPFFPHRPDVQFNWSHSGRYVLCALSRRPVGVDIEVVKPRRETLPAYALTETELAAYKARGGGWPIFYDLWTRKEAWCKYTGEGLRALWGQTPPDTGLHYGAYAGDGWRASVCGEEPAPGEILWVRREELE